MPSISFGDSTPSIYEDVLKPVSPIVRDYAFAGPLPNSNTVDPDAATPFEVRNSAYIASPVGHQHGQPGPLTVSIPNEPAPSYEASLASARPAYTSKDLNDVWQSAQDASEAYREEAPAAAGPVSLSRKLWAVVLCFLLFMIANGICVFGMLCAVGGMDEQDDSMKRIIIAAVISGMLTASLTSFLAFTAYCAFEHRARASREVSV